MRVRSVLDAPRGARFTRTPAPTRVSALPETREEREQRLLRQMVGNPRVAYRLEHGQLPHWMIVAKERREQAEREVRAANRVETDPDSFRPRKPRGRHRAPRWRGGWAAATLTYGMALAAGMVISQVAGLLL